MKDKLRQSILNWCTNTKLKGKDCCVYAGSANLSEYGDSLRSYGKYGWNLAERMPDGTIMVNSDVYRGRRPTTTRDEQNTLNKVCTEENIPHIIVSFNAVRRFIHPSHITMNHVLSGGRAQVIRGIFWSRVRLNEWGREYPGIPNYERHVCYPGEHEITADFNPDSFLRERVDIPMPYTNLDSYFYEDAFNGKDGLYIGSGYANKPVPFYVYHDDGYKYIFRECRIHKANELVFTFPVRDTGRESGLNLQYEGVFLHGTDENQTFVSQIRKSYVPYGEEDSEFYTPAHCREWLKPTAVLTAEHNDVPVLRQGEWFFVYKGSSAENFAKRKLPVDHDTIYENGDKEKITNRWVSIVRNWMFDVPHNKNWEEFTAALKSYLLRYHSTIIKNKNLHVYVGRWINKQTKKFELPRAAGSNSHTCKGFALPGGLMICTGTVKHSAKEHSPLELGSDIYMAYKNTEIASSTSTFDAD